MTVDTQQLDQAFLDLTLADDELMRAEFDALIAACWESPCEPPVGKPRPPVDGQTAGPPSRQARRGARALGPEMPRRADGRARGPPRRLSSRRISMLVWEEANTAGNRHNS